MLAFGFAAFRAIKLADRARANFDVRCFAPSRCACARCPAPSNTSLRQSLSEISLLTEKFGGNLLCSADYGRRPSTTSLVAAEIVTTCPALLIAKVVAASCLQALERDPMCCRGPATVPALCRRYSRCMQARLAGLPSFLCQRRAVPRHPRAELPSERCGRADPCFRRRHRTAHW